MELSLKKQKKCAHIKYLDLWVQHLKKKPLKCLILKMNMKSRKTKKLEGIEHALKELVHRPTCPGSLRKSNSLENA